MTEDEKAFVAKRRGRNIALGLTLLGLTILFYILTYVRLPR